MNRTQLPLSIIIIQDRQRECKPEAVASLAESMKTLGLIQPIVINQNNRLIAGGHRLAAARLLGWEKIDVVYLETLSEAQLQELELTENVKRSDLSWQERCIAIAKIHALKQRSAALDSKTWGQKETGEMLNVSQGYVSYVIIVSRILLDKPKDHEIWKCESLTEAWNLVMRWQQDEAVAKLSTQPDTIKAPVVEEGEDPFAFFAEENQAPVFDAAPSVDIVTHELTDNEVQQEYDRRLRQILEEKGREGYYLEVNEYPYLLNRVKEHYVASGKPEADFDAYWQARLKENLIGPVIDLSSHYIKGDSIEYMRSNPARFDHIITDIPYGIDIENIDQQVGIKDIETIKNEHTVEGNLHLFDLFFDAGFVALKETGFLITWCDIMNWQYMYDQAIAAGFKVTRWPVTWSKPHGLNQMAQFNFTKTTEIAMVCRKGLITLVEKQPTCVIEAGRDALCEKVNHPFAKPFECWRRLMAAVSAEGQSILDPFVGRGSSYLSGLQLNRNMYGCEINDAHYNAGLENIKGFYLNINPRSTFI